MFGYEAYKNSLQIQVYFWSPIVFLSFPLHLHPKHAITILMLHNHTLPFQYLHLSFTDCDYSFNNHHIYILFTLTEPFI